MKKAFVFLIALVLLVTAGIFAVSAETQAEPEAVWCDRCRKNVPANEWMEWTATGGDFLEEGHFYLADTFTEQESTINIRELKFVCLDLRGNTWITEDIQPLSVVGDFSIMDSVGGGLILTTGANGISGGFASVVDQGALNLFGGTIQFVPREDVVISNFIGAGTVNVDGATVTGGVVNAASDKNAFGGNFYLSGTSRLNLISGKISKGMNLTGSNKQGGNIYAAGNSVVTISGGSLEDGYAASAGGNIHLAEYAQLNLTGGTISGGMSPSRGGNISMISTTAPQINISGGTITGGVAAGSLKSFVDETDDETLNPTCARGDYGGGNIYGRGSGSLTISGGTIDGDIKLHSMGSVTLSGSPKIGLGKSTGLLFESTSIRANVSGLTDGAEIYVQATSQFTAAVAEQDAERIFAYFKPAIRTTLSVSSNAFKGASGTQGYCPHCKQLVTWTAATSATNDGDHIYLNGSKYSSSSNLSVSKDTVLDLNGYSIARDGRRVIINYQGTTLKTLSILDSWGGGKIEGSSTANASGGAIYVDPKGALELYSGTLRVFTSIKNASAANIVKNGGVICASGNVTIHGGRITGGVVGVAATNSGGGNISMTSASGKLTINGGIIQSGKAIDSVALNGGNIYSAGTVEINGGIVMGGKASAGGNIYSTKTLTITDGIIWSGEATGNGGNINATKLTASGGVIGCGVSTSTSSTGGGGNIRVSKADSTISGNATVLSGEASMFGGNIYCLETMTMNIQGGLIAGGTAQMGGNYRQNAGDCTLKITGGKVLLGSATNGGGNLYINNGKLEMTGGEVSKGTAPKGGNIYLYYNAYGIFKDDGDTKTALPVVSHGTATTGDGGNIAYIAAGNTSEIMYYMQLGNCEIYAGTAGGNGDNVYVDKTAKFEVLPEFAQNTSVYFHNDLIVDEIYLDNTHAFCNGNYAGTLLLENRSNLPKIITTQADLTLVIGQAALVMGDGSVQWFGSNSEAIAAYTGETAYIQPGAGELALPAGAFVVDLAGQNVTLTGNSEVNVYCFDSANTSYATYGTATINGPVLNNTFKYTVNGVNYVTVAESEANAYSFHCLGMRVSSVSVRPGSAGIYYSCTWECDDVLKTKIDSIGVAVSTANMPDANFATDTDTLFTKVSAEDMELGKEYNSVLINKIFSDTANNNATRGVTPVYATPYVTLEGGKSIVCEDEFKHSLQSVLGLFDSQAYYANKSVLESFYQKWESAMKDWDFANIGVKPQDDDTLRILMGGNSFAYYYVEELYGLLMENLPEGVKDVEVYNIYYSGRGFYTHWLKWSTQAEGDYHLFKTDKNGRRELTPIGKWTFEEVLAMENWDYIGLQGVGKSDIGDYASHATLDAKCEDLAIYAEELFGYIHEMFPYTQLLWHRTWAQEVGRVTNTGFEYTEEYNERYDPGMQYVCDYMTEVFDQDKPYDLIQVNSGAAWREARRLNETRDLLPYGGLCAMLARNTYGDKRPGSGDGQHDGDIGGGQLINAYMWYMTITGDGDLTDNNYKPDYEMSDDLWNMLKQATMTIYNGVEPERVETPEEAKALRIMIIGSSRSVNTFQHLYLAIKDQMPDQELTLGVVYYSGGSMSMHADFIRNRQSVVTYYRNTGGSWELFYNHLTRDAIKDQKWDVILLQGGTGDTANNMNLKDRQYLTSIIDSWLYSHPHQYWWHTTWFNSTDPVLYENANTTLKPEEIDQVKQLTSAINSAKQYVMDDPMFDGHICSGTPLMYAINVLGVPETELYRDHTHLSDFGSLVVGYAWYTQFTGKAVTEINLDVIPANIREPHYQDLGDLEITKEMKEVIIKTCQYTLENPWTVPTK